VVAEKPFKLHDEQIRPNPAPQYGFPHIRYVPLRELRMLLTIPGHRNLKHKESAVQTATHTIKAKKNGLGNLQNSG